jgi:NAD(P)-dependent dehydrogenase (short-subunit alcohol dehydrogenase family)
VKTLANKNAVITGGSEGIGLEIARIFAENGANLLLIARNNEKLNNATSELSRFGVDIKIISHDLSDTCHLSELCNKILTIFPDIHILVNNAALAKFTKFEEVGVEELTEQIDLNLKAPFLLIQGLLNSFIKNKASVINISSFHAEKSLPVLQSTAFSATKGALNSLTKSLAYELGTSGIRVNAVAPGNILTTKVKAFIENIPDEKKLEFGKFIKSIYPLGKIGQTLDIANMVLFLASEQASWITGSVFNVDGGLTTN